MKDAPETTLILKRSFKAPVDIVYAAWTDPAQFVQWIGGVGPIDDAVLAVLRGRWLL